MAWKEQETGYMLNRTNGFRALSRFFRPSYLNYSDGDRVVTTQEFDAILDTLSIDDDEFNVENFPPGSTGESLLFQRLITESGLRQ
jgi:hypothetical protein